MRCANPRCNRTKPKSLIGRLVHGDVEGVEREGAWYCSEECWREVVLQGYRRIKRSRSEKRTATYPISARSFGASLVRAGIVSWSEVEDAMEAKSRNGGMPLAFYLMSKGLIDRQDILEALGRHHRVPVASVGERRLSEALLAKVPAEVARTSGVIPVAHDRQSRLLSLVMKDPTDLTTLEIVGRLSGCEVKPVQGDPAEINRLLERHYNSRPQPQAVPAGVEAPSAALA